MTGFICPSCKRGLVLKEKTLVCENGHCFDLSKSGYVNLLLPGKGIHGDDKRMVRARRAFFDGGDYAPLMRAVAAFCSDHLPHHGTVLDCGCGEGSYTTAVAEALALRQDGARVLGVDISKDAAALAAKKAKGAFFAVASVFHLPVADASVHGILNLFAPMVAEEYARVLKEDGWVLKATPLPRHLYELKAAVYEKPYLTEPEPEAWDGFVLQEKQTLEYQMHLTGNDRVRALFEMTPYCYTTPEAGWKRLEKIDAIDVTAAFQLAVYRKK